MSGLPTAVRGQLPLTRLIPLRYDGQRCTLPAHLHELYGAGAESPSCPHRGQPGLPPVTASHTPRAAERPYILPRMRGKTNETGAGLTFLSLYVPVGGGQPRFRRMTKSSPAGTAASALLRPGSTRGGRPCCHYAPVSVEPGRYSIRALSSLSLSISPLAVAPYFSPRQNPLLCKLCRKSRRAAPAYCGSRGVPGHTSQILEQN